MKKLFKSLSLSAVALALAAQAQAAAVGTFGVDSADVLAEITLVGTVMIGIAVAWLVYKSVRRLAR